MTTDSPANKLQPRPSCGDFRFFFDSIAGLEADYSPDDAQYCLYRFLRNGNRDSLLRGLSRREAPIRAAAMEMQKGNRNGPQSRLPIGYSAPGKRLDTWVKGAAIATGPEDCETRYRLIAAYVRRFKRPFSVLDLDAGTGYFALRIAEDFNAVCIASAVERDGWSEASSLHATLEANANQAVVGLRVPLDLDDLSRLAHCEQFDVVLGLTVFDRIDAPARQIMEVLRSLGQHVIVERARDDQDDGFDARRFFDLGNVGDRDRQPHRSMMVCKGYRASLQRPRLRAGRNCSGVSLQMDDRHCLFMKDGAPRSFTPGLNVHTFLYHQGFYPDPSRLAAMLSSQKVDCDRGAFGWSNVVLGAAGLTVLDADKGSEAPAITGPNRPSFNGNIQMALMEEIATLCGYRKEALSGDYVFQADRPELSLLGKGWGLPEDGQVWSTGYENILTFPSHIAQTALSVRLKAVVAPMADGFAGRYVMIKINGHILWENSLQGGEVDIAFTVPQPIWNLVNPAVMTVEMDHLYNPLDEGDGMDDRNLGIALKSLHVSRAGRRPWPIAQEVGAREAGDRRMGGDNDSPSSEAHFGNAMVGAAWCAGQRPASGAQRIV